MFIINYGLFYTKGKKIRDKETNIEKYKRCLFPSIIISFIIVSIIYFLKGRQQEDILLDDPKFFDE